MSNDVTQRLAEAQVALENASGELDDAQRRLAKAEQRVQRALTVVRDLRDSVLERRVPQLGEPCDQCGPGYRIGDDGCRHGAAAAGPPPPPERPAPLPDPVVPSS